MFGRFAIVSLAAILCFTTSVARAETLPTTVEVGAKPQGLPAGKPPGTEKPSSTTKEILTDAAIVALIITASIAAYKAMGKPCACPDDTMRNGRRCGSNSAYAKPGGYKPLCHPGDITAAMISTYRATKAVPGLR